MELLKAITMIINFFLVLGVVGGMENDTIPLTTGFIVCMALIGATYAIMKIKVKNQSQKGDFQK